MAAILALVSAVLYGTSDFLGTLGARRSGLVPSTAVVHVAAAVALLGLWPLAPGAWTPGVVVSGLVAGVLALAGMLAFYAALAIGPMSVLSPLIAALGATVPVLAAVALGERFGGFTIAAIVGAIAAAGLVSAERGEGRRVSRRALALALLSGATLGGSLVALDRAPAGSGLIAAELEIGVGVVVLLTWALVGRVPMRVGGSRGIAWSVSGGVLLGAANAGIVLALAAGELAIVSVLVCLYPVATVLLATIVLRERMSGVQVAGIALALAASVVLALAS